MISLFFVNMKNLNSVVKRFCGFRTGKAAIFAMMYCLSVATAQAESGYVLQRSLISGSHVGPYQIIGDATLLNRRAHPASLFKIVILIALLREGKLDSAERFEVEERISNNPVDIRQATYRSSNRAFLMLVRRLDARLLREEAIRMRFFRAPPPASFARSDSIYRGEDEKTDPLSIHRFMMRVARGADLAKPEELHNFLLWPGSCLIAAKSDREIGRIHAKSGAWGGSAWISGFCAGRRHKEVVTVFVPYEPPHWRPARERAIRLFYGAFQATVPDGVFY